MHTEKLEKIIRIANKLDKQGRYDDADFVMQRLVTGLSERTAQAAPTPSTNQAPFNIANIAKPGNTSALGEWWGQHGWGKGTISDLYNMAVSIAQEVNNANDLGADFKKQITTGFQEIAMGLAGRIKSQNANAQGMVNAVQTPAGTQTAKAPTPTQNPVKTPTASQEDDNIRVANVNNIGEIVEQIKRFRDFSSQVFGNSDPEMLRWIATRLNYMVGQVSDVKSGSKNANTDDYLQSRGVTFQYFVQRVQNWINQNPQQRKSVSATGSPIWMDHLRKNQVPENLIQIVAPYIR